MLALLVLLPPPLTQEQQELLLMRVALELPLMLDLLQHQQMQQIQMLF
jgi:hypothetical protein